MRLKNNCLGIKLNRMKLLAAIIQNPKKNKIFSDKWMGIQYKMVAHVDRILMC